MMTTPSIILHQLAEKVRRFQGCLGEENFYMNTIIVNEEKNLNKVRALLYACYLEHFEWEIEHTNPSGIKIQKQNHQTIIADDYDNLSIWFSVLEADNCIACGRLCYEDQNGLLEIERYPNARKSLQHIFTMKKEFNLIELNREAMLPKYENNPTPYLLLLKSILQYCIENNYGILTTSNLPKWVSMYNAIGFQQLEEVSFKYCDSEPLPVIVYLVQNHTIKEIIKNINTYLNRETITCD